jgi:tetratricopeptide (TPR) repeat protein
MQHNLLEDFDFVFGHYTTNLSEHGGIDRGVHQNRVFREQAARQGKHLLAYRLDRQYPGHLVNFGQYAEALAFAEALAPQITHGREPREHRIFIGYLQTELGHWETAYAMLQQALKEERDGGLPDAIADVLGRLAYWAWRQPNPEHYPQGLRAVEEALAIVVNPFRRIRLLDMTAKLYLATGAVTTALTYINEALAQEKQRAFSPNPHFLRYTAALCLQAAGQVEEARAHWLAVRAQVTFQADHMQDEDLRRSWLENIPMHADLMRRDL